MQNKICKLTASDQALDAKEIVAVGRHIHLEDDAILERDMPSKVTQASQVTTLISRMGACLNFVGCSFGVQSGTCILEQESGPRFAAVALIMLASSLLPPLLEP